MKKNLLALLMGTMVVATLVAGCGAAKEEAKTDDKAVTEDKAKDEAKDDAKDDAKEEKTEDAEDADAEDADTEDADAEDADASEEDADLYYADLSAELAGSSWVSTDEEVWLFGDDGATFYVTDGDNEAIGSYSLEMITDGDDTLMGLTMTVSEINFEAFYFVTDIDEENGILYLLDEDGNESALVEYVAE